jgi:hypothetical protein
LPDVPAPEYRPNVTPENDVQERLQNMRQTKSFDEWSAEIGEKMTQAIIEYAQGGELSRQAKSRLKYLSGRYGFYNGEDLLRVILQSFP